VNIATDIVGALAPGVALTSGIFYSNGLHNRLNVLTTRVRDLNREARGTGAAAPNLPRLASIRRQVQLLLARVVLIQRAILLSYVGLLLFIVTTVLLLSVGIFEPHMDLSPVADAVFGGGLLALACAMVFTVLEMDLSNRTLADDTSSSFPDQRGP
jgi:hypothetical protein